MEQLRAAVRSLKPDRALLSSDLVAALTFAVVNVPQAMGHALLATVNPVLGIFTLMVAVPVGAIFNSSVFMNVSSTAALSVAAGVVLLDFPADQKVEALVVLVLLVGVIQLLAGLFRLGFLVRFVSNAVMTGFLNGVAVLIILGQLSDLTGYASTVLEPRRPGAGPAAAHQPDRPPGEPDRAAHAGADRPAAVDQALAALRLHHRHRRGHRAAGGADDSRAVHGRRLRRRADGR